MLSLANSENGQITQSLYFTVGSDKLKNAGLSSKEIEDFKTRLTEQVTRFRDEFYLNFVLIYAQNPNPDYQIGKALVVTTPTYQALTDTIGFHMVFAGGGVWNYYHQSSGESTFPNKVQYGFMITTKQEGAFPFAARVTQDGQNITVGERYINGYKNALAEIEIDYDPDLVYDYATSSKYLKSDATFCFQSGLHHHVWMKKTGQLESSKIVLYTSIPNAPVWYVTLLGVTLIGLAVAIVIIKIKGKTNKKQS